MKVLLMSSLYLPNVGGVETTLQELASNYKKQGVQVVILTKRFPDKLSAKDKIGGIDIYRMISPKNESEFEQAIDFLKKNEKKIKADIIHLVGIRRHLPLFATLLSKHWKVPVLMTFSGGDVVIPDDPATLQLWEEGLDTVPDSVYQADAFTTFSKSTQQYALSCLPKIKRVDILYGGLNVREIQSAKKFTPSLNRKYLISIRRLFYSKGVDLLIKAFHKIAVDFPDLDLYIIGDGPEEKNLKKIVKELKILKRVRFLGALPHTKTLPYLKGAIAAICPSRSEGGGLINFEAQAAGCVSIGSQIGGIPEYIKNNITGLLFESENSDDLEKTLRKVLNDPLLRERLTKQAAENIIQYDWSVVAERQLNYYRKMIQNYKSTSFVSWSPLSQILWKRLVN